MTLAEATETPSELFGVLWFTDEPRRPRPGPLLGQGTFAGFEASYIVIHSGLKPKGICEPPIVMYKDRYQTLQCILLIATSIQQ